MTETLERPVIGQPWQGGIYAGISMHNNQPVHLILLPGDAELTWKQAFVWAAEKGGEIPSRVDALILLQNVNSEFKMDWYWTSMPHSTASDGSAWYQSFEYGYQNGIRASGKIRARAVRRIPIQEAA